MPQCPGRAELPGLAMGIRAGSEAQMLLMFRLLLHQATRAPPRTTSSPLPSLAGKIYLVTEWSHPVECYVRAFKLTGCLHGVCHHEVRTSDTDPAMPLDGLEEGR